MRASYPTRRAFVQAPRGVEMHCRIKCYRSTHEGKIIAMRIMFAWSPASARYRAQAALRKIHGNASRRSSCIHMNVGSQSSTNLHSFFSTYALLKYMCRCHLQTPPPGETSTTRPYSRRTKPFTLPRFEVANVGPITMEKLSQCFLHIWAERKNPWETSPSTK